MCEVSSRPASSRSQDKRLDPAVYPETAGLFTMTLTMTVRRNYRAFCHHYQLQLSVVSHVISVFCRVPVALASTSWTSRVMFAEESLTTLVLVTLLSNVS